MDAEQNAAIKGLCYDVELEGINKGSSEETGNIVATLKKESQIGEIYRNSDYGIMGVIDKIDDNLQEVETNCWYNVKRGKANILVSLDGKETKSYEVEITGIDYISKNRNIKIKVIDEELIEKTGGIVQGMSGTPLMQERKTYWCSKLC